MRAVKRREVQVVRILPALKGAFNAITDERYRYYYRQRRVENLARREALASRVIRNLPPLPQDWPSQEAAILERDGIAYLPDLLTPSELQETRSYFQTRECGDPYRAHLGRFLAPKEAPPETHVAYFANDIVIHAPHVLKVANHPLVLAAVAGVLGAKPTISFMTAWWSLPARGEAEHAELYHRDYDDLRFVKLFLYLTDVDVESGPHAFVRGSHKQDKILRRTRFSEDDVAAQFPPEDCLQIEGRAGTNFLENTFGLHRGIPPVSKPRLIFQVLYSLRPYIAGPAKPIREVPRMHEGTQLDPYINRSYCSVL